MENKVYLTKEGLEKLKAKFKEYIEVKRPDASEKIKEARSFGDLSENAEYDAAKDEQAMIEAEIKKMEEQLNNYELIDESASDTKSVRIGSTVTVSGLTAGNSTYEIVGSTEADISTNPIRISNESPLAQALIGKKEGDKVSYSAPKKEVSVKIVAIKNI